MLQTLLLSLALAGNDEARTIVVEIKPEEASGYAANPSMLATPLRQDLTKFTLVARADGKYDVAVGDGGSTLALQGIDLALMVPRIPKLAKAAPELEAYALLQREYNRNEVKYGAAGEADDFKLANNCLKQCLWEVMLDKKVEKGNAMFFHGWFAFPEAEYARIFDRQNGKDLAQYRELLAVYPKIDGMDPALDELRTVASETKARVETKLDEAPIRFGEQKRKAKLILTQGIARYADFVDPKKQPIAVASFQEPGFYEPTKPMQADIAWLAKPKSAVVRKVKTNDGREAEEVDIAFENGKRILFADATLGKLTPRAGAPDNDKDLLRLTFGIGTPDIYASLAERRTEQTEERANWLFLLGPDGKHVDNHQAGVDRVFLWREEGGALHAYLVGYERIAVVSHLVVR